MPTMTTLITELRTLARDLPISNRSSNETPKPQPDGTGTRFRLQNPILFSVNGVVQIWWSDSSHYRQQTGVTVDDANMALITISPAPATGFVVDYFFNWFVDSDYSEFLNNAARDVVGFSDPTRVQDGLIASLLQYGMGHFYQARRTQYLHRYSTSGGQSGTSVSEVAKAFADAAKDAFGTAKDLRDQFYERLGAGEAPASATTSFRIDPITPPR